MVVLGLGDGAGSGVFGLASLTVVAGGDVVGAAAASVGGALGADAWQASSAKLVHHDAV
jgi:hypothetical protein